MSRTPVGAESGSRDNGDHGAPDEPLRPCGPHLLRAPVREEGHPRVPRGRCIAVHPVAVGIRQPVAPDSAAAPNRPTQVRTNGRSGPHGMRHRPGRKRRVCGVDRHVPERARVVGACRELLSLQYPRHCLAAVYGASTERSCPLGAHRAFRQVALQLSKPRVPEWHEDGGLPPDHACGESRNACRKEARSSCCTLGWI
jgi:hypothetical protein